MKRRDFVKSAAVGAATATAVTTAPYVHAQPSVRWRMATSWPAGLDTLFGGAQYFCEQVSALTDGRFQIRAYAGGELVGGLQVLEAVQQGTVQAGHTPSYYYVGHGPALAFDTSLPFGLTTRQQDAWMYHGGGHELMNKEVFSAFNILSYPGGNSTMQMGGWFREEVPDLASLKGLKMRIPGYGGQIMAELGVNVQTLAAAEIYPALERGVIDATEFVGPYDDKLLGFYQVAKYYYAPSWWEPGPQLSIYFNRDDYAKLPKSFQIALQVAAAESNQRVTAHYDNVNPDAMTWLLAQGTELRAFSDEIMQAAQKLAFEMYEDLAGKDPTWAKIYGPWKKFRAAQYGWNHANEFTYNRFAIPQVTLPGA